MASRSRTLLFLQYRNSFSRTNTRHRPVGAGASKPLQDARFGSLDQSERAGLIANEINESSEVAVELSVLPPKWIDVVEEVEEETERISDKIHELEALHKKHLLPGFDDRIGEEQSIEALTDKITSMFQECQRKIKRVNNESQATAARSKQTALLSKNIQTSLATKLQDLSHAFRRTQSNYLQKLRGRETRSKDMFGGAGAAEATDAGEDELDAVFTDTQLQLISNQERAITEREREINDIVKSINGLATVFKELQAMVIDQGTVLDRIDYNIEQTSVHIEDAHAQLQTGVKYQKRAGAKLCIIALILLIAVLIVALYIKLRTKSTTTATTTTTQQGSYRQVRSVEAKNMWAAASSGPISQRENKTPLFHAVHVVINYVIAVYESYIRQAVPFSDAQPTAVVVYYGEVITLTVDDFDGDARKYDDYLERLEDWVYNLVNQKDVEKTEEEISEFNEQFESKIKKEKEKTLVSTFLPTPRSVQNAVARELLMMEDLQRRKREKMREQSLRELEEKEHTRKTEKEELLKKLVDAKDKESKNIVTEIKNIRAARPKVVSTRFTMEDYEMLPPTDENEDYRLFDTFDHVYVTPDLEIPESLSQGDSVLDLVRLDKRARSGGFSLITFVSRAYYEAAELWVGL
ncbi:hypothetical protein SmJEL517_g03763 [Synchytrium microbalum]|uniref:t-SNARE coiled-coil homology domain-containing protein n=1 Tax=Synchytrium microbalum TaxID=1806994 RepID=A0A507C1Y5_9FUNG|nr:uncharacterized protein SmJEL517_g03763 [Synchytrium microbalum]TPX33378.1 hypothetical protein SmJEL517_g03763 [Synchytrium microbalum]